MKIDTNSVLFALSLAIDCVEQDLLGVTSNHSKRAAYMSMLLCRQAGMEEEDVFDMASCAILHDNALTEYMRKRGKAELKALENIASHCLLGETNAMLFPFIRDGRYVVKEHHENWDGSGFFGIQGQNINPRARALRLADNVDLQFALGVDPAGSMEDVITHLEKEKGVYYDPEMVEIFQSLVDDTFVSDLENSHIDAALARITPPFVRDLELAELTRMTRLFSSIIDAKSTFTLNHSLGMADIAQKMGYHYGFRQDHLACFIMAAHLHDVGKLAISNSIIDKPGKLDDTEYASMKTHVSITHSILSAIDGFENVSQWAGSHHERLNGTGYPLGLKGNELSLEMRMLACIDVYQALTENRPYRAAMSHEKAISILKDMADKGELDMTVVKEMDIVCR